jgi:hypothetical protein
MKTTKCVNFFLYNGYFYESKDVGINISYICAQLDFKNSSSIFFNQLSQFSLKINEIIHPKWSFCFLKVEFGMLIGVA